MTRPLRADARRNRDRIVAVARDVFAEHGAGASLDEVAKRAGVGPGTLYRHFPNREALQGAVYRESVQELCERARERARALEPGPALESWLRLLTEHLIERRDLAQALVTALGKGSEVLAEYHRHLHETGGPLVERAKAAGVVRADLDHRDVLWLAHGVAQSAEGEGGAARVPRLLDIALVGMGRG